MIGLRRGTLPSNDAPSKLHHTQNQQQGGATAGGGSGNGKSGNATAEGEAEFVQKEHEKEWSKIQGFVQKEQQQAKKQKGKKENSEDQSIGAASEGIIGMPGEPLLSCSLFLSRSRLAS